MLHTVVHAKDQTPPRALHLLRGPARSVYPLVFSCSEPAAADIVNGCSSMVSACCTTGPGRRMPCCSVKARQLLPPLCTSKGQRMAPDPNRDSANSNAAPTCPKCNRPTMRRVQRVGFFEQRILPLFGYFPWECAMCRSRSHFHLRGLKRRRSEQPESA